MKEIIIASKNSGKISEYKNGFKNIKLKIKTLLDYPGFQEIEETGNTFKENAYLKAKAVYDFYKIPVIADDSGLIVKALPDDLGVKSKRFSKSERDDDNISLLLEKLADKLDKTAEFVTVICYYKSPEDIKYFSGRTLGKIVDNMRGNNGFGYDPVFLVHGIEKTYAELDINEKQKYSHRGKAIRLLLEEFKHEDIDF
jgi:XTP/dITP diphosphohydrolase